MYTILYVNILQLSHKKTNPQGMELDFLWKQPVESGTLPAVEFRKSWKNAESRGFSMIKLLMNMFLPKDTAPTAPKTRAAAGRLSGGVV